MARDPEMPLTDVQWVMGHARLSTTQMYLTPLPGDVIAGVAAFHARRAGPQVMPEGGGRDVLSSGYRPESLEGLVRGSHVTGSDPRRVAGADAFCRAGRRHRTRRR